MKSFFKKLGKIAAVAVGAAAVAFTAGSALSGSTGGGSIFSGGWSGISRSVGDLFGEGSALSNVVGGAVKYGGYGSLIGGAVNAVRGKSITDGMTKGALGGGVAGGLLGGLNMAGLPQSPQTPQGGETDLLNGGGASDNIAGGSGDDMLASASKAPMIAGGMGDDVVKSATGSGFSQAGSGGGNGLLSWLNQNPTVAGMAVQGVGQGLSGYSSSAAEEDAAREASEAAMARQLQQQQYIAGNYGSGEINPGRLAAPVGENAPTPEQRFDPVTYGGRYVYDRATGRAVFIPNETA